MRYYKAEELFYGLWDDFSPDRLGEVIPQDIDMEVTVAHMPIAD